MDVYCVKDRRVTPNVEGTEKIISTKDNRKMLKVKCAVCGIIKTRFFAGKLTGPSLAEGSGILSSVADAGFELFISKGILFLAKKGVEASRHYASEAMRNPALQKKAINYGMKKARPAIEKVGRELLDQVSTIVRPNYRY